MTTAGVICGPPTQGTKALDWTVPDVFEQELFEKYGTPELIAEAKALGIPVEKQMEWCKLGNAGKAQHDYMLLAARAARRQDEEAEFSGAASGESG